jgi:hypothetical protein
MELSEKAGIQKERFEIKIIPSDLTEGEKERCLFEVFVMLLAFT